MANPEWHDLGQNVEAARIGDVVAVRRSENPSGYWRIIPVHEWIESCPPEYLHIAEESNVVVDRERKR